MQAIPKKYLGDSVYAACGGDGTVVLTTENGSSDPSNIIVLEDCVIEALMQFVAEMRK